jgi:hypothetical protein
MQSAGKQFSWEINQHVPDGGLWSAVVEVNANGLGSRTVKVKEAEANARLIAAAPELLAAVRDCVEWLESVPLGDAPNRSVVAARAVIAKAEGRE